VRGRRQLVHQHRQRLLRRPAVLGLHLGRVRRHRLRLHRRPGLQVPADSRRREGPRRAGQGCLAELRHRLSGAAYTGGTSSSSGSSQSTTPSTTTRTTEQPASRSAERPAAKKTVTTPTGKKVKKGDGEYKVVKGDTLSSIAEKKHVKGGWQQLFKLNKDIIDDADFIYPGQQLHLG
jgi:LysM repeat protein